MSDIVSISFDYNGATYYALMRSKTADDHTDYYITVMNGSLEMVLYGNHVFSWAGGILVDQAKELQKEVATLRECIAIGIRSHLHANSLETSAN